MIDASKFSKPSLSGETEGEGFHFGLMDNNSMAAQLRTFADAIEHGQVAMQTVQTGTVAKIDDYLLHGVYFEYAAKVKREEKALYGAGSPMPVAIVKFK